MLWPLRHSGFSSSLRRWQAQDIAATSSLCALRWVVSVGFYPIYFPKEFHMPTEDLGLARIKSVEYQPCARHVETTWCVLEPSASSWWAVGLAQSWKELEECLYIRCHSPGSLGWNWGPRTCRSGSKLVSSFCRSGTLYCSAWVFPERSNFWESLFVLIAVHQWIQFQDLGHSFSYDGLHQPSGSWGMN